MLMIEDFYKEWRWLTYNKLDSFILRTVNQPNRAYPHDVYTDNIIEKFETRNFEVTPDQIANYDDNIKISFRKTLESYPDFNFCYGNFYWLRSIFIENCLLIVDQLNKSDFLDKINRNIIYYNWWDELSYEQLSLNIINSQFLSSTKRLIGQQPLFDYFYARFRTKDELINHLLSNFTPSDYSLSQMNAVNLRGSVMFDYVWLFGNELTKSIRIFENECRFEFNEKIVGSFFNENLLFREIKKKFGKEFTVVSQGSPEWLRPQRFDIYFPQLNIAIEYQGEQHFYPVDFGGRGKKIALRQFQENIKRDNLKIEKANENNCSILHILPKYDITMVFSELQKLIIHKIGKGSQYI